MSRMLASVASHPHTLTESPAAGQLQAFAALARLHRDGWATAATDGGPPLRMAAAAALPGAGVLHSLSPARARLVYVRFASGGAAPRKADVQPFVDAATRTAFAHNGALIPRERAAASLTPTERAALTGRTDSEVYFRMVLGEAAGATPDVEAVARAARRARIAHPDACLNAFVLAGDELIVVHSQGTRPTPLPAFAARGISGADLPPGHDDEYNLLAVRRADGIAVVATSGIDRSDWNPLPPDTVTLVSGETDRSIAL